MVSHHRDSSKQGRGLFRTPVYCLVALLLVAGLLMALTAAQAAEAPPSFLLKWGAYGTGDGQFNSPFGLAVDSAGNVYVADFQNNRVQKFNSSGAFLLKWGSLGTGNGQFNKPWNVAVDSAGNVYVSDANNGRIQKFNSSGAFLLTWGSVGTGNGQFNSARGIAVDALGNVYVADSNNQRIQKFNSSGAFVTKWGISGTGNGQFQYPYGVAVDGSGNVYVADTFNQRIQKFDSSGNFLLKWGGNGASDGLFQNPWGMAVDGSGNVYVADYLNYRIQKFTSGGVFVTKWGSSGAGNGQFSGATGVAVDGSGNVYVADQGNHRIQKFGADTTPPQTTIASSPPNPSGASAAFSFTSSEAGSTFQCQLDSGGSSACTSPKSYSGLSAGSHTFQVKATDLAGNVDATPASFTWTVDATPPSVGAVTPTSTPKDQLTTFSATYSDDVGVTLCVLNVDGQPTAVMTLSAPGGASGTATASHYFTSVGAHTAEVQCRDAAINIGTGALTAITVAPASSAPGLIYTLHLDRQRLGIINVTTGRGTDIGALGNNAMGLTFDTDGTLYTIVNWADSASRHLATVNTTTGAATPLGGVIPIDIRGLEIAADGAMYTIGVNAGILYRIDKSTGALTAIGNTGLFGVLDLAFDASGTLWARIGTELYTVNLSTGAATAWPFTISNGGYLGIMFGQDNTLYFTGYFSGGPVVAMDISTGAVTSIGNSGLDNLWAGDIVLGAVQDATPPALTLPANITAEATGPTGAAVTYTASASDAVDGARPVACAPASGSTFAIGTATVTCSASDTHGNTSTGSFTVTVRDTTPPVVTSVPANITAEATGPTGAVVTYTSPTATDLVDGARMVTCAPASGSTFAIGTATVTCSASDTRGNTGSGSFTVTVRDTTPPVVASVPANITAEATGPTGRVVTYASPTATDIVDGARAVTCAPASGSTFAIGTATVTCSASDTRGNTGSASFTVTVQDTTPPVVTAPANITAEATSAAGRVVTYTASASDIVDGVRVVTCAPASGSTFAIGTTTITCSASDTRGNTGSASFTVTVQDTTPPVVTVPANMTAEATSAAGAVVTYTASATDIVDGSRPVTCAPASGSTFAIATATVNCSAVDTRGNTGSASFTVTVRDTTPPVVTSVPANITTEATGPTGAAVTYASPTATDIVDGVRTVTCAPASGSTFAIATATVTCSASDTRGNTGSGSFTVTVRDTTPPVVTSVPANITAEATGPTGAAVTYASPTATDIVDGARPVSCTPASGSTFAIGTATVTCSASDSRGNTSSVSFTVTVQDTTPPVVTVPANITAEATSAAGAVVTYTASASDIVDGARPVTCTPASGSTFALDATTVSCSSSDTRGNTSTNSFTVTVRDTTPPVVTASRSPAPNASGWNNTDVTVTATGTDSASGIASCTTAVVSAEGAGQSATVSCTDNAGNPASATLTGINIDMTGPVVLDIIPTDASIDRATTFSAGYLDDVSGVSSCTLSADGASLGAMALSAPGGAAGAASKVHTFSVVGAHTMQVKCLDAAGNEGEGALTNIGVADITGPTVSAASPTTALAGQPTTFSATYTDNVGATSCKLFADGADQGAMALSAPGGASGTASKSYTFNTIGVHTAQVTCQDAEGNVGAGPVANVTVPDTTAPTVGAASPTTASVNQAAAYSAAYSDNVGVGSCTLYADGVAQGAMTLSAPGGASGTASKSHTFGSVGAHTVQVKCQDAAGNLGSGPVASVAVSDTAAPGVSAPMPTTASAGQPTVFSATYADNVGVASCTLIADGVDQGAMSLSAPGGTSGTASKSHTFGSVGAHTAQVKCQDAAGNQGVGAVASVSVTDDTAPTVGAASPTTAPVKEATTYSASYSDNIGVTYCSLIADGIDQGTMSLSNPGGANGAASKSHTFATLGAHTAQVQCRDAAGNETAGVAASVNVVDTVAPTVGAASPATATLGQPAIYSAAYADNVGVTSCTLIADGADQGAMALSLAGGAGGTASKGYAFGSVGSHTVQVQCRDASNNTSSGPVSSVSVVDATAPTVGGASPAMALASQLTTFSATYADNVGVVSCVLVADGVGQGAMALSAPGGTSGTASKGHTFATVDSHTVQVKCQDAAGNEGTGPSSSVSVFENAGPVVSAASPVTTPVGQSTSFSATYSDATGVTSCNLLADDVGQGAMSLSAPGGASGTASRDHTFASVGNHTLQVKCQNTFGLVGPGVTTTVNVVDNTPPVVSGVSHNTSTGQPTTLSATYTDNVGVSSCTLLVDGVDLGAMSLSAPGGASGTASRDHTFANMGNHTLQVKCRDNANNEGSGAVTSVSVSDGTAPTVGAASPTTASASQAATFSATYGDNVGVTSCTLFVDEVDQGAMTLSAPGGVSGTASKAHTFNVLGIRTVQVKCGDAAGNLGSGLVTDVTVTDTTKPTVGPVSPATAVTSQATTFSATYADNIGVASCILLADGFDLGAMTLSAPGGASGTASKAHTFTTEGNHTLEAKCLDAAGNDPGRETIVTVSSKDTLAPVVSGAAPATAFASQGPTFSATYSDNIGVSSCSLFVNGVEQGPMLLSAPGGASGTASRAHVFSTAGSASVQVKCKDAEGNEGPGAATGVGVNDPAVQFDLKNVFNADVVVNKGQSGADATQNPVQVVTNSVWRCSPLPCRWVTTYTSYYLASQTFVNSVNQWGGYAGLPDDGLFARNSFHPDVALAARNEDNGLNALRLSTAGPVKFDVPPGAYSEVHAFATAVGGSRILRLRFYYSDGTTVQAADRTVPDWTVGAYIGDQTADLYYLARGVSRATITNFNWALAGANDAYVYGLRFTPDPSKTLTSVSIEFGSTSGALVVFGATGLLKTAPAVADTTPPVLTPIVTGAQGKDGWYTADVKVSWTLTDPESALTSVTGCANTTVNTDTAGLVLSCDATSFGGVASKTVTVKRDAAAPTLTNPGDVAVQVAGQANSPVSYSVVSAADATSGVAAGSPACSPASGSVFLLGSTPVECKAADNAGNTGKISFTVSVVDASAGVSPTITLAQSQLAGPGQTVTASTAGQTSSGQSGVSATLTNGTGGAASLTVATYAGNPTSATYFDAGGRYTDVMVQGAGPDTKATVSFYYPATVPDYTYYTQTESYYDGPYPQYSQYTSWGRNNYSYSMEWDSYWNCYCKKIEYYNSDGNSGYSYSTTKPAPYSYSSDDYYYGQYYGYRNQSSSYGGNPYLQSVYYGPYYRSYEVTVPHKLTYYDGSKWAPVLSSGGVPPVWNTADNLDGTVSNGRFTVVFDMTSTPKITELAGTAFGDGKDTTQPVLSGVPANMTVEATNPAGATPTYTAPTATDNLDGPRPVTCTPASGDFFPLGLTTVTCKARDTSGNTASASFTVLVRDTAPPVVKAVVSPQPNANGWHSGPVAVSFSASDKSSGVTRTSYSVNGAAPVVTLGGSANTLFTADGVYNVSYTATDNAGNTSAPATLTVRIDTTPPTVAVSRSPGANANGWSNTNVTAIFQIDDAGSGPESIPIEIVALSLASGQPVTVRGSPRADGASASFFDVFVEVETSGLRVNGIFQDKAGNRVKASISGIRIDKTAPTVTVSASPAANASGWNSTDVTVTASGTDDRSGIASCASVTLSSEGAGQSAMPSCTDKAGNTASATVSGINIDKGPPEAFNEFDPATLDLKVVGRDGGSGGASVVLVSSVPVKWGEGDDDDDEDADDEKEKKKQAELRTYKVTDKAGNTLLLVEKVKKEGKEIKATIVNLQYNGGAVLTLPKNEKKFEWSLNKDGSLKELEQKLTVGKGKDKEEIQAKFDAKKNETAIRVKEKGKDDDDGKKVVKPGLALVRLATDNGKLGIEY